MAFVVGERGSLRDESMNGGTQSTDTSLIYRRALPLRITRSI